MDKKRKNENDEISQLLDSFQTNEEDTCGSGRYIRTKNGSIYKDSKSQSS